MIKNSVTWSLLLLMLLGFLTTAKAQKKGLTKTFKSQTIDALSELMNDHYVFPKVAKETEAHLAKQLEAGHFDEYESLESFAEALTASVQEINKDKHMRIAKNPVYEAPENTPERQIEERLRRINRDRSITGGMHTVKKLEGNVGYLDLRGFAPLFLGQPVADDYMSLLASSDAVIVDLRRNGGGSPDMVQYLCSYFFGEKVHLNSLYWRRGDRTDEFWTLEDVGGEKMPDVPLFVMTSKRTFSGAEEFSYNMQTQKRATLVGETTGGGANPGQFMRINEDLGVFIPTGRAINPITQTNWEGVGVIPEVKVDSADAMDKAHALAKAAAETYRAKNDQKKKNMLSDMFASLDKPDSDIEEEAVIEHIKTCQAAGLIAEEDINGTGYAYLMRKKKPQAAMAIFKANTILYPHSANVYDSYAESLLANGKHKAAVKMYQKALDTATKNGNPNVEMFQENLDRTKKELTGKK